jgi:glycosyltransferase involved in cell wall biosynthesis
MKILHVCSNYFPAHGGPQYIMKHLSEKLTEYYKDSVDVATSNSLYGPEMPVYKIITPARENVNGVNIYRYNFKRWHYKLLSFTGRVYKKVFKQTLPHFIYKYRWELDCNAINKMMKESDADVIMATTVNYMFCDYPFWRYRTKKPKPFILYGALHLHINWPFNAPVLKRSRACDSYIANTSFEKEKLIEYGVSADKIVVVGTGITPEEYTCTESAVQLFRKEYGIMDNDILIGHIGRLSPGKGVAILLESFLALSKKNNKLKLLLAGTSTEFVETIKDRIAVSGMPIILIEDFDPGLKAVLFNSLDIFVLASPGESFGIVFLEAWACKKPVIGVAGGAVASLISEDVDGLLFQPGSQAELMQKLTCLADDKLMRAAFGEKGFEKIHNNFTWPVIIQKYRAAYLLGIENFKKANKMK